MNKSSKPNLRPYYRLSELMELTESRRNRLVRLLHRAGIETRRSGRVRLVFLSDIEARMPELWRSLVLCERARAMARAVAARERH